MAYFVPAKNTALNIILYKYLHRPDFFPWNKFLEVQLLIQRDSTSLSLLIIYYLKDRKQIEKFIKIEAPGMESSSTQSFRGVKAIDMRS